jgi:hypothetical protein
MGTISMRRKSRHDVLKKEAVGSDMLYGGSGWSNDMVSESIAFLSCYGGFLDGVTVLVYMWDGGLGTPLYADVSRGGGAGCRYLLYLPPFLPPFYTPAGRMDLSPQYFNSLLGICVFAILFQLSPQKWCPIDPPSLAARSRFVAIGDVD